MNVANAAAGAWPVVIVDLARLAADKACSGKRTAAQSNVGEVDRTDFTETARAVDMDLEPEFGDLVEGAEGKRCSMVRH